MATVLLTGASGFLGVHTMRRLLDDGHRVRALVRSPARLQANLLPLGVEHEDESNKERRAAHVTLPSPIPRSCNGGAGRR